MTATSRRRSRAGRRRRRATPPAAIGADQECGRDESHDARLRPDVEQALVGRQDRCRVGQGDRLQGPHALPGARSGPEHGKAREDGQSRRPDLVPAASPAATRAAIQGLMTAMTTTPTPRAPRPASPRQTSRAPPRSAATIRLPTTDPGERAQPGPARAARDQREDARRRQERRDKPSVVARTSRPRRRRARGGTCTWRVRSELPTVPRRIARADRRQRDAERRPPGRSTLPAPGRRRGSGRGTPRPR